MGVLNHGSNTFRNAFLEIFCFFQTLINESTIQGFVCGHYCFEITIELEIQTSYGQIAPFSLPAKFKL